MNDIWKTLTSKGNFFTRSLKLLSSLKVVTNSLRNTITRVLLDNEKNNWKLHAWDSGPSINFSKVGTFLKPHNIEYILQSINVIFWKYYMMMDDHQCFFLFGKKSQSPKSIHCHLRFRWRNHKVFTSSPCRPLIIIATDDVQTEYQQQQRQLDWLWSVIGGKWRVRRGAGYSICSSQWTKHLSSEEIIILFPHQDRLSCFPGSVTEPHCHTVTLSLQPHDTVNYCSENGKSWMNCRNCNRDQIFMRCRTFTQNPQQWNSWCGVIKMN